MKGQTVILLLLERCVVQGWRSCDKEVCERREQGIDDWSVVQHAVKIGSPATLIPVESVLPAIVQRSKGRRRRTRQRNRLTHMNFIAAKSLGALSDHPRLKHSLARHLATAHRSRNWQQTQSRQTLYRSFYVIGVSYLGTHYLIAATDADNRLAPTMSHQYRISQTGLPQPEHIVER